MSLFKKIFLIVSILFFIASLAILASELLKISSQSNYFGNNKASELAWILPDNKNIKNAYQQISARGRVSEYSIDSSIPDNVLYKYSITPIEEILKGDDIEIKVDKDITIPFSISDKDYDADISKIFVFSMENKQLNINTLNQLYDYIYSNNNDNLVMEITTLVDLADETKKLDFIIVQYDHD